MMMMELTRRLVVLFLVGAATTTTVMGALLEEVYSNPNHNNDYLAKIIDSKKPQDQIKQPEYHHYDVNYKAPQAGRTPQKGGTYDIITLSPAPPPPQDDDDVDRQRGASTGGGDDESVSASTWMTVTKHVCVPDHVYDRELHACRRRCPAGQTFYNGTRRCENPEAAAAHWQRQVSGMTERPMCRNITVDSSEFTIVVRDPEGDEDLQIDDTNITFSRGNYVLSKDGASASVCFPYSARFIRCHRWKLRQEEYELRRHGLQLWSNVHDILYGPGDFYVYADSSKGAVTCFPEAGEAASHEIPFIPIVDIYATTWTVSAISMLISFIIYFASQKLRKSHTKVLLGHMVSLFVFYVALILRAWGPVPSTGLCMAYGIILHYTFLSALFWLNVLAFDIWKRLPSLHSHSSSSSRHRFMLLSTYAWGCPLLLAVSAVLVDSLVETYRFRPGFATSCWFETIESKAIFMYGPAAVLLACNVFFFVMTVVKLRMFSKDVAIVNKKINNQMLKMYIKLLVVMGLCWIMEIVSALINRDAYLPYWYFTDIINGLQGFFFFLVYVCKRSVLRDLMAAWRRRRCCRRLRPGVYFMRTSIRSTSQPEHFSSTSIIPSSDVHGGSVCTGLSATNLSTTLNQTSTNNE